MNKIVIFGLSLLTAAYACRENLDQSWRRDFREQLLNDDGLSAIIRYELLQRNPVLRIMARIESLFPEADFMDNYLPYLVNRVIKPRIAKRQTPAPIPGDFPLQQVLIDQLSHDEAILAVIRYQALQNRSPNDIIQNVTRTLHVPEDRIRYLLNQCMVNPQPGHGPGPPRRSDNDDNERRIRAARENLERLSREPDLLERVIAIDEVPLAPGINVIVAYWRTEIIAFHVAPLMTAFNSEQVLMFVQTELSQAVMDRNIDRPVILMDNIAIHHTTAVRTALSDRQWDVLAHPPRSSFMNPVDVDLARRMQSEFMDYYEGSFTTDTSTIQQIVECVVTRINNSRQGTGTSIAYLRNLWQSIAGGNSETYHSSSLQQSLLTVDLDNAKASCPVGNDTILKTGPAVICYARNTYHYAYYGCRKGACWTTIGCSRGAVCTNNIRDAAFVIGCKNASDCDPCNPCNHSCKNSLE